jgi:osmotically-inducible protein OsmY
MIATKLAAATHVGSLAQTRRARAARTNDACRGHRQELDEQHNICEKIREVIVADKSLSLYAQNIEISGGYHGVTLKGFVKSVEEKEKITSAVAATVKVGGFTNELIVRSRGASQPSANSSPNANEKSGNEQEYARLRRLWGIAEKTKTRTHFKSVGPER